MSYFFPLDDIWSAVKRGDLNKVREFAERDGFPAVEDGYSSQSLLTVACAAGHLDVVRFLLENRSKIPVRNYGSPEAFIAMEYGRIEVLRLLAEFDFLDPDSERSSKHDPTLFQVAVRERQVEATRLLLSLGGCLDTTITEAMDNEITQEEVEGDDSEWPSFIELAARSGDTEFVRFLVEVGVDLGGQTADFYLEQAQQNAWKYKEEVPDSDWKSTPQRVEFKHQEVKVEKTNIPASETYRTFWGCVLMVLLVLLAYAGFRAIQHLLFWLGWTQFLLWSTIPLTIYLIGKFGREPPK